VGTYGSGPGQFNPPDGSAADGTDVYVADFINQRVQWFTSRGMFLKSISGPDVGLSVQRGAEQPSTARATSTSATATTTASRSSPATGPS